MALPFYSRYCECSRIQVLDTQGQIREGLTLRINRFEIPKEFLWHVVIQGETLDYLAWKYFGNEELWWKIAEANEIENLFPFQLEAGKKIRIPSITEATRISRRRSFE
jgi:nucleoid-associated protein YgaU